MKKEFIEVAGEALEETREKFKRYWKDPEQLHMDSLNFGLGLFTGIVLRRMRGEPDPVKPNDDREGQSTGNSTTDSQGRKDS